MVQARSIPHIGVAQHAFALLGYFSSGGFTVFIFTIAIFLSAGGVDWNDFGIFLGLTTQFLIAITLAGALVFAYHELNMKPWMKWTRLAYIVGGIIGFSLAFLVLVFIAIASLIAGA